MRPAFCLVVREGVPLGDKLAPAYPLVRSLPLQINEEVRLRRLLRWGGIFQLSMCEMLAESVTQRKSKFSLEVGSIVRLPQVEKVQRRFVVVKKWGPLKQRV